MVDRHASRIPQSPSRLRTKNGGNCHQWTWSLHSMCRRSYLDTVEINKTAILAVIWVTADRVAAWVHGIRIAVVVSIDTTLEDAMFTGFNSTEIVSQESLDTENTIKIFNTLVIPSPGWRIIGGKVGISNAFEESWVRLQHDPVHVGTGSGAGVGEVGWVIDSVTDFLVTIVDEGIVDSVDRLHHESSEVNQN